MKFHRSIWFYKDYLLLSVLLLFSIILILMNENRQVQHVKMSLLEVVGALQEKYSYVQLYFNLKEENERLRKENVLLSFENASLREKAAENKRLKELIGFKEKSAFQLLPAKVISRQKRGFINDIVLAIGHADSVLKNMPVIVPAGLVGKLYQVGKTKSNCQLLLDQNFRVSAFDQRSRVAGIVKWTGSDYCWLSEVPKHADVIMGDSVITSGYGEIFPPGISIGQVISVNEAAPGLFVEIRLKPTVNFDKLEEVFVIKSLK